MRLELFQFIDQTMELYEAEKPLLFSAEKMLRKAAEELTSGNPAVIGIRTRVKSAESLRGKLLRNKYYLNFSTPEEALANIHDLVGITIDCQFIRNETDLYQTLFYEFCDSQETYSRFRGNEPVFLNLHMPQPQLQRNGYAIYRIDGYCLAEGNRKVAFELQIKSLVHRFWSEIEHELVYKNQEMLSEDRFIKNVLGSIKDNLDVVDHQLDLVYTQIHAESERTVIGMDATGFKRMTANSINELVHLKMRESVGFTFDFRKDAAILAQYIYIRYFLNGNNNEVKMVEFLEHLNMLKNSPMDFRSSLEMEGKFTHPDPFCNRIGFYFLSVINTDFEWHAFFTVLFAIQDAPNLECLNDFAEVLSRLLIQPGWYESRFADWDPEEAEQARRLCRTSLAEGMVEQGTIEIIHEDSLLKIESIFRRTIEKAEAEYSSYEMLEQAVSDEQLGLKHQIAMLFQ